MYGWTDKPERQTAYLDALRDLLALDCSVLLVRYDLERGFGLAKRIDIWWGGLERNGALMLLLAYLIGSADRWRDAEVRVLTVVASQKRQRQAEAELARIMERTHLTAETRVLRRRGTQIAEIMREESGDSDLVLVGLRQPRRNEKADDYLGTYERILEVLPTTILVASSPSFEGTPVLFDGVEEPAPAEAESTEKREEGEQREKR